MQTIDGNRRGDSAVDAGYWITISDLMAGLLAIFILALVYFMTVFKDKEEALTDNNRVRTEILKTIEIKLKNKHPNMTIQIDTTHGVLRLPNDVLFEQGEDILGFDGRETVSDLAEIIFEVLTFEYKDALRYKDRVETIFVEGHTDTVRMAPGSKHASNWELSSQRAINTWLQMKASEEQLDDLKNNLGQKIFSCSGYAATRPVDEDSLVLNRRIDLRFAMSPPPLVGLIEERLQTR